MLLFRQKSKPIVQANDLIEMFITVDDSDINVVICQSINLSQKSTNNRLHHMIKTHFYDKNQNTWIQLTGIALIGTWVHNYKLLSFQLCQTHAMFCRTYSFFFFFCR